MFVKKCTYMLFLAIASGSAVRAQQGLSRYIDPFIGTGGHGHTFPGACVPFGMVQLSPDNGSQGWDWCSGYNYSDTTIAGFSHMHLSGTGCGDWTDISFMPHTAHVDDTAKFFRVGFNHKNERAGAGWYHVQMNNGVTATLTATERCGMHEYIFPKGSTPFVRLHLRFGINWDSAAYTMVKQLDDSTVVGYRFSTGWAKYQRVFFAARFSVPIKKLRIYDSLHKEVDSVGKNWGRYNGEVEFADLKGRPLKIKVALSSVTEQKALLALNEIPHWDLNKVKTAAIKKWDDEMAKLEIKTPDEHLKRTFYTALYHTCIAPNLFSDADGEYQNANGQKLTMHDSADRYTVFSLWDTFRGLHPLLTITQPKRLTAMMNSMLAFSYENGLLPVWDLSTYETNCMSGYHAVPVLADAVLKNTPGVDAERAFEAMIKSAYQEERGVKPYCTFGYVPQGPSWHSVTKTLEYSYDDWCIAQVAKKLGKNDQYKLFKIRASAYQTLFDANTGFIRAKDSTGKWIEPFDPYFTSTDGSKSFYEEGNAWQYTFFVPHDVRGLANAFGNRAKFTNKLDALFSAPSELKGESAPPDVSGLIGQYAHGNEPSHHIAYMYSFVGEPWKTQKWVHLILDSMYHDQPEGYSGNEDCGQMSAWAVWSMMGMYPANPCGGEYVFAGPSVDEVKMALPNGKQMIVRAKNAGKANPYIQAVTLNGAPYTKVYIDHETLLKGGVLEFEMGGSPNKEWGIFEKDWPSSMNQ